jgi:phage baseplate assembly protein W
MPDFGTAWSCVQDLTMPATLVSGFRVVGEAIARRWSTPRGALVDDPNYGTDITGQVGADMGPTDLSRFASTLAAEAQKDQRVRKCSVTATQNVDGSIVIVGNVTTTDGPFSLVATVSNASVQLLQVST